MLELFINILIVLYYTIERNVLSKKQMLMHDAISRRLAYNNSLFFNMCKAKYSCKIECMEKQETSEIKIMMNCIG